MSKQISLILIVGSLLFSYYLYQSAPNTMDKSFMMTCLVIVTVNLVAYFSRIKVAADEMLKKVYFRHTLVFIVCFIIVFFQCDLDYLLGFSDESDKLVWTDTDVVCKSMALATIAFCSVLLGFTLYRVKNTSSIAKYIYTFKLKREVCYFGFFMLVVYLVFVPREYLMGGYDAGVERGWANVILVLLQAVFITMFSIYCYEYKNGISLKNSLRELRLPIILVLLYMIIVLLSGRRTEVVRMAILLMIVISYIKRDKINYKIALVALIGFAFLFTAVSLLRKGDDTSQISKTYASVSPLTRELAGSVNTLHVAVSNFPDPYPYTRGITFFPNFCVLVPGLDQFYQNNIRGAGVITSSAELITFIELGNNATFGMGSSIVADIYISFGVLGVIIIFILLGLFIRHLEYGTFCRSCSPYFLILSFGCCSQFMFACRGTIANMFLSWSYATILMIILTTRSKNKYAK